MAKQLTEEELRRRAVQALSDSLRASFSRADFPWPFDYQEWRREYFSRYGVDDLLEEVENAKPAV